MKKLLLLFSLISLSTFCAQKFSLIIFIDYETSFERTLEYIECMEKNIRHPLIDDIHVLYNYIGDSKENIMLGYLKQQPVTIHFNHGMIHFTEAIALAHSSCKNDRIIIANPDIYFDNTLFILDYYQLNYVLLSITAYQNNVLIQDAECPIENPREGTLQDAWIFQKPFYYLENTTVPIGTKYSGSLINVYAVLHGVMLLNPCLSIKIHKVNKKNINIFWKHPELDVLQPVQYAELPVKTVPAPEAPTHHKNNIIASVSNKKNIPFIQAKDKKNKCLINPLLHILKKNFNDYNYIEISNSKDNLPLKSFKSNYAIDSKDTIASHLREIIQPYEKYIFFLNELSGKSNNYIPYITELNTLKGLMPQNSVIVIANAHLFYSNDSNIPHTFNNYPTFTQIIDTISSIDSNYKVACIDDLFLFYINPDIAISSVTHACTISRLYDDDNDSFSIIDVIEAEKIIAEATRLEKETIKVLAENYNEVWNKRLLLTRHYPLWYGLILFNNHEYKPAYDQFKEAYNRGLTHWRIKWYMELAYSHLQG